MVEQRLVSQRVELVHAQLDTGIGHEREHERQRQGRERKIGRPHAEDVVGDGDAERQQGAAQQQGDHLAVRNRDRWQPTDERQRRVAEQSVRKRRIDGPVPRVGSHV